MVTALDVPRVVFAVVFSVTSLAFTIILITFTLAVAEEEALSTHF